MPTPAIDEGEAIFKIDFVKMEIINSKQHHTISDTMSKNLTVVDILVKLPEIYCSFNPRVNHKLFRLPFTNSFHLVITNNIRDEVCYPFDTNDVLMQIVDLITNGHGHIDVLTQNACIA